MDATETMMLEQIEASTLAQLLACVAPLFDYAATRNELFVPGTPFAALPVESLYKQWTQLEGNAFGAQRGLFLGDAARHVRALYEALDIQVPAQFASMPDHLTLELELLSMLLEVGNLEAAREFARDHLDWLGAYDAVLAERATSVESSALNEHRCAVLLRGIDFTRALVALVDRMVERIAG